MITQEEIKKIKEEVEGFLNRMTITDFSLEAKLSNTKNQGESQRENSESQDEKDIVDLNINLTEPQFLIGQNGQTLFDLQRILRIILNKKLQKSFYIRLDINDYRKKKIDYLKKLARELADQVSLTKEKKILPPMPAYERRIIHLEMSQRSDVVAESQGEGINRCVVISSKN